MVTYEDLTAFTKWGADQAKITLSGSYKSIVTHLNRSDEAILYKDYGVGNFALSSGIEHDIDIYFDDTSYGGGSGATSQAMTPWALTNYVGTYQDHNNASERFVCVSMEGRTTVNKYGIQVMERYVTAVSYDLSIDLSEDTIYYLKIKIVGNSFKVGIYSTAALRNAGDATDGDIDNCSITLSSSTLSFRYLYSVMSRDNYPYNITTYQENYDLHEEVEAASSSSIVSVLKGLGIMALDFNKIIPKCMPRVVV